jgi:hypothetical protein
VALLLAATACVTSELPARMDAGDPPATDAAAPPADAVPIGPAGPCPLGYGCRADLVCWYLPGRDEFQCTAQCETFDDCFAAGKRPLLKQRKLPFNFI